MEFEDSTSGNYLSYWLKQHSPPSGAWDIKPVHSPFRYFFSISVNFNYGFIFLTLIKYTIFKIGT